MRVRRHRLVIREAEKDLLDHLEVYKRQEKTITQIYIYIYMTTYTLYYLSLSLYIYIYIQMQEKTREQIEARPGF